MSVGKTYQPGPAAAARIESREGENWTLVLVKQLKHPPERVWRALTDPEHLREWAPFDADANLGREGATVRLATVGAPKEHVTETVVRRAVEPRVLEFNWGGGDTRWELEPTAEGTKLTLWAQINKNYIAMGAAGWHICIDVMDLVLGGSDIERIVGPEAMQFEGWQRLHREYSEQFKG